MLGGHRADAPYHLGDLVVAPGHAEALLVVHRLVVAQRAAALADRQARRGQRRQVHVGGDGGAGLVDGDRAALLGDVLDALGGPRLDRRDRLDDVLPAGLLAPGAVG